MDDFIQSQLKRIDTTGGAGFDAFVASNHAPGSFGGTAVSN
jgi:hypothetical protein